MAEDKKVLGASKVIPEGTHKFSDIVNFKAEYPDGYKGKKHLQAEKVYPLHKLHAERLAAKGIGKIV